MIILAETKLTYTWLISSCLYNATFLVCNREHQWPPSELYLVVRNECGRLVIVQSLIRFSITPNYCMAC